MISEKAVGFLIILIALSSFIVCIDQDLPSVEKIKMILGFAAFLIAITIGVSLMASGV